MLHHMLRAAAQRAFNVLDPYFQYVTMLLHGDGTNGAQNNTFLDSSTNNFTITRNGNTTQGTFTPYGSNWSNYFNGSTDYLQIAYNSALDASTGPFTYEAWLNPSTTTNKQYLGGTVTNAFFAFIGSGTIFVGRNNVAVDFTSSANIVTNQWNHVVIVRNASNNIAIFINGASAYYAASNTNNYGLASNPLRIGVATTGSSYEYGGYISNVRISKSALYDPTASTITVPTTPLTAVSGTALLTCQSNRFVDNSTNAFAITTSGTPSVQRFSPFSPTTAYSTSVIGGSGYFDGSGDYLTAAQNAAFNFGTGAFTVEAWVYITAFTAQTENRIIGLGGGANGGGPYTGWSLTIFKSSNQLSWYKYDGTVTSLVGSFTFTTGQWYHIVAVRNGSSNLSMYVNGSRIYNNTSATLSYSNVNSDPLYLARISTGAGALDIGAYITDARVVAGTAIYDPTSSTLTVPTAPLTAVSGTSLLLNTTNAGILDNAMMNDLETVGNAQISTSVKKYGTGSMYFDGTGDALYSTSQSTIFGTGDFTLEFWIYFNAVNNSTTKFVYDMRNSGATSASFLAQETDNSWTFWNGAGTQISTGFTGSTFSATTWTHVAICRNSGTTKFFVNGTQTNSVADTSSYANSTIVVGSRYNYANGLNAYIDDLRITKGYARYTTTFTPPTAAFPNN